jgi:metallo-beta-lactamase family protein
MRIRVHGAAGDVTGSAYHVITKHGSVLVDAGLYQGGRQAGEKNRRKVGLEGGKVDAVVLTHCHLDHVGRLPLLTQAGYKGPIYATQATFDIARLILRDALRLQQGDLERDNRRRKRAGQPPLEPLYVEEDVLALKPLLRPVGYDQPKEIFPGVTLRLVDAGHVIGSSSVELTVDEDGRKKIVVFSGDLGPRGAPLIADPVPFERADAVFMESTYGNRNHRSLHETAVEGRKIIAKAIGQKGKILVPVFAVGRTQLLLYLLAGAFKRGTLPRFPIYLDSPLAIEATKVYQKHNELFDAEAKAMVKAGELREQLSSVKFCPKAEDSMKLNEAPGPCLIMAGSGMCTGGRIMHHLRHNLSKPETAVLIVGWQSQGSLGRQLVDGATTVKIFGEDIAVKASVHTMGGFSAHADQNGLIEWFGSVAPSKPRLVLTHGEDEARDALAALVKSKFGVQAEIPALEDVIEM